LRRKQTNSELTFWEAVRNRKILGFKFYRQYAIFFEYIGKETFFVADFYCYEKRLVVKIDGKIHDYQKERDKLRTYIISMLGIEVVRFRNEEMEKNLELVLDSLKEKLK
jgi:very-short-patch-repair endonuclease